MIPKAENNIGLLRWQGRPLAQTFTCSPISLRHLTSSVGAS